MVAFAALSGCNRSHSHKKDGKYPVMAFRETTFDFGTINPGDVVHHWFVFKNDGVSDLFIDDAKGSCGCTVPAYPKHPVAVGAKDSVKVTFDSAHKQGMQRKSVFLMTNTQAANEVLKIEVNINPSGAVALPATKQK